MYVEQIYTGCLAEAAYYVESNGVAAIIDPIRETEPYTELAAKRGAKIQYIFETHFHADFVSGHLDLAAKTGATIVFGPTAQAKFEMHQAQDGEIFQLGGVQIQAIHTPGHTPESTCFLLIDESGDKHSLFTGDTLFVGDVGRPDLLDGVIISKEEQVANLYYSIQNKIKTLPDDVIVYPGHGPGSLCGKSMGKETQSTIGQEKATNYALRDQSMEEFVNAVLSDQLPAPQYFVKNAIINRTGYDSIETVMERNVKAMSPNEFEQEMKAGAIVLDARNADEFEKGFVKSAVNIGLDGSFAVWVGTLIDIKQRMLVVAPVGRERETILRLARVGYENVAGYLEGGFEAWLNANKPTDFVKSYTAQEFAAKFENTNTNVLDVRRTNEFELGHVVGAVNEPLRDLPNQMAKLAKDKSWFVHCAGGYRSMVAISLMKAAGFNNACNVYGGFDAIKNEAIPLETAVLN